MGKVPFIMRLAGTPEVLQIRSKALVGTRQHVKPCSALSCLCSCNIQLGLLANTGHNAFAQPQGDLACIMSCQARAAKVAMSAM
jgi:hypothetical protein